MGGQPHNLLCFTNCRQFLYCNCRKGKSTILPYCAWGWCSEQFGSTKLWRERCSLLASRFSLRLTRLAALAATFAVIAGISTAGITIIHPVSGPIAVPTAEQSYGGLQGFNNAFPAITVVETWSHYGMGGGFTPRRRYITASNQSTTWVGDTPYFLSIKPGFWNLYAYVESAPGDTAGSGGSTQ